MQMPERLVTGDFDADTTRFSLMDTRVFRCKRCHQEQLMSIQDVATMHWPVMFCGACWDDHGKRVELREILRPEDRDE